MIMALQPVGRRKPAKLFGMNGSVEIILLRHSPRKDGFIFSARKEKPLSWGRTANLKSWQKISSATVLWLRPQFRAKHCFSAAGLNYTGSRIDARTTITQTAAYFTSES